MNLATNGLSCLLLFAASQLAAQTPTKRVFCDYHLGPRTRATSGQASIWRLYDDPTDPNTAFFPQMRWSGDAYVTADRKETVCTYYPLIGPYDILDGDLEEYHILLAKAAGIDGFLCEWQWINQPKPTSPPLSCVKDPAPDLDTNTTALQQLALKGSAFSFPVGVNWTDSSTFQWYKKYHYKDCTAFNRYAYLAQATYDLDYVLLNVYAINGPMIGSQPLVLLWNVNSAGPGTNDDPAAYGWLTASDIHYIRTHLEWVNTYQNPMPIFLGRDDPDYGHDGVNSGLVDVGMLPELDGYFSWHRYTNTAGHFDPWTGVNTIPDQLGYLSRFLSGTDASHPGVLSLKQDNRIAYYMTSCTPRFDNHKGLSFGLGDKVYMPDHDGFGPALSQMRGTWPSANDLGFVVLFNFVQENTGVEPSHEFGYQDIDLMADEIAQWKGTTADHALLRLPERLYRVRKALALIQRAIDHAGGGSHPGLDSAFGNAQSQASTAAGKIAFGDVSADVNLTTSESSVATAMTYLVAKHIDLLWTYGSGSPDLSLWEAPEEKDFNGRTGQALHDQLRFSIVSSASTTMNAGQFVGRMTLEVVDAALTPANPNRYNWLRVVVPGTAINPSKDVMLDRRSNNSMDWRELQFDIVDNSMDWNTLWSIRISQYTDDQLTYCPPDCPPTFTDPAESALRTLRIEGWVYQVQ